jgi:hypothetical protein
MPPEGGDLIFDRLLHEYCATSTWRVPQNQREFVARMGPNRNKGSLEAASGDPEGPYRA